MAKKVIEREALSPETLLTVKDAARLSNMSVPAFYTERNKSLLGFYERDGEDGVWLIKVQRLVDCGFLTDDFEPVRGEKVYGDPSRDESDFWGQAVRIRELSERVAQLERDLELVSNERDGLRVIAEDRAKQIEMINSLIATMGGKSS